MRRSLSLARSNSAAAVRSALSLSRNAARNARGTRSRLLSSTASPAVPAAAPPASPAAAASPSSTTTAKPRPKRFRYFMLAISPLIGYWWVQRSARNKVLASIDSTISASEKEIKDLLQRCNLGATDVERLGDHLERSVANGRTRVDDFAKYVSDYVNAQKNMVKDEKERKKSAIAASAMEVAIAELQRVQASGLTVEQYVDRQMADEARQREELKLQGKELPADIERKQAAEDAKNENLDEKTRLAKFSRERFDTWDLLCLLRATPVDSRAAGEISEMLVALAQMSFDSKPEEELLVDPDMHAKQVEQINLNPFTKLELAWRAVDRDRDGVLSHADFIRLMGHMLHTGHFAAPTALVKTQAWPPQFRVATARELADTFYGDLGLKPGSPIRLQDFAAAAEALSLSKGSRLTAWYLQAEHVGFFRGTWNKWAEEARRLQRAQSLGAPLAGIAAEREQNRLKRVAKLQGDKAKIAQRVAELAAKKKAEQRA